MKKAKIMIGLIMGLVFLSGCSLKSTATDAVKSFLDQYRNLSANVLTDLDNIIEQENFSDKQKKNYRDALKKQYSDLKYEIVNEAYDGNIAVIEAKITVYDYYKAQEDASVYLAANPSKFVNEDGVYDNDLFLDYKLEQMMKTTDTVEYTIDFDVTKNEDGDWEVESLSHNDLEKIHGIYNYNE